MDFEGGDAFTASTTSSMDFSLGVFEPVPESSLLGTMDEFDLLPSEPQFQSRAPCDEGLSSSYTGNQPELDIAAVIRNLHVVAKADSTGHSATSSRQHSAYGTPKAYSTASSGASSPSLASSRSSSRASGSRRNSAESRRKRKEPKRDEFATEVEYQESYLRWRQQRDSNNRSVKRSREKARERLQDIEGQNVVLLRQIEELQQQVRQAKSLAFRARHQPTTLSIEEEMLVQSWAL
eukprot:m.128876 g.128876  ORF g.128876 m.128876 type:complete len:236 (+) comp15840_c0_seq9:286-993(+)